MKKYDGAWQFDVGKKVLPDDPDSLSFTISSLGVRGMSLFLSNHPDYALRYASQASEHSSQLSMHTLHSA